MRKILIAAAVLLAAISARASDSTSARQAEIGRQWKAYSEIELSVIHQIKSDIAEALLEPDQCLHRRNPEWFDAKHPEIKTPVADLRKRLDKRQKEYRDDKARYIRMFSEAK